MALQAASADSSPEHKGSLVRSEGLRASGSLTRPQPVSSQLGTRAAQLPSSWGGVLQYRAQHQHQLRAVTPACRICQKSSPASESAPGVAVPASLAEGASAPAAAPSKTADHARVCTLSIRWHTWRSCACAARGRGFCAGCAARERGSCSCCASTCSHTCFVSAQPGPLSAQLGLSQVRLEDSRQRCYVKVPEGRPLSHVFGQASQASNRH